MCGIVGYVGRRPAVQVLIEGLKRLEYRGYDSAGIAVVRDGRVERRRVKGKIAELEKHLSQSPLEGSYGIAHTRWATHGKPSEENAHPHSDCTGQIVLVHNGIIENYAALKKKLQEKGHRFTTQTDTEVIAHLIEENYRENLLSAVAAAVRELEGSFAIAVISSRDPGKIVAAKKGPPLIVGLGEGENLLASDIPALLDHTRNVVILEDGELALLTAETVKFFNFQLEEVEKRPTFINWDPIMAQKGGYKHFMLKEIHEQPRAIRDTLEGRLRPGAEGVDLEEELGPVAEKLMEAREVNLIACGTSYHAALIGKFFFESLAGLSASVEYASEFRYRDFVPAEGRVFIFISQSGETADTLAAARLVKEKGEPSIAVVNVVGSALTRVADATVYTHAGPEIAVASTKAFTSQLTVLLLLSLFAGERRGRGAERAVLSELQRIPAKIEAALASDSQIERLAHRFFKKKDFLYLGRWVNYPIALEGALKLKEISYIHAEGYPAGEMKHGPIALIDEEMPVVAVVPRDRVYEKMISNIEEVLSRDGTVIAVTDAAEGRVWELAEEVIRVPSTEEILTPFLTIIPLQLFAYHMAVRRGADVDQPRNLAKSVVVE